MNDSLANLDPFLWENLKQGDKNAFSSIYTKYMPVLFSYGYRLQPNEAVVKDCIQNVFIGIWKSRQNLSSTDSIKFYLFRCLRREIVKEVRHLESPENVEWFDVEESPEEKLISYEQFFNDHKTLENAMKSLSPRQSEVVHLRYFQELEVEEISGLLGISAHAVYKLIYRAISTLQRSMVTYETRLN